MLWTLVWMVVIVSKCVSWSWKESCVKKVQELILLVRWTRVLQHFSLLDGRKVKSRLNTGWTSSDSVREQRMDLWIPDEMTDVGNLQRMCLTNEKFKWLNEKWLKVNCCISMVKVQNLKQSHWNDIEFKALLWKALWRSLGCTIVVKICPGVLKMLLHLQKIL